MKRNFILILLIFFILPVSLSAQEEITLYKGDFDGIRCRGMATYKLLPSDSNYVTLTTNNREMLDYIAVQEQGSVLNIDVTKKNANLSMIFEKVIIGIMFTTL